jgi:hypothetical protein
MRPFTYKITKTNKNKQKEKKESSGEMSEVTDEEGVFIDFFKLLG